MNWMEWVNGAKCMRGHTSVDDDQYTFTETEQCTAHWMTQLSSGSCCCCCGWSQSTASTSIAIAAAAARAQANERCQRNYHSGWDTQSEKKRNNKRATTTAGTGQIKVTPQLDYHHCGDHCHRSLFCFLPVSLPLPVAISVVSSEKTESRNHYHHLTFGLKCCTMATTATTEPIQTLMQCNAQMVYLGIDHWKSLHNSICSVIEEGIPCCIAESNLFHV